MSDTTPGKKNREPAIQGLMHAKSSLASPEFLEFYTPIYQIVKKMDKKNIPNNQTARHLNREGYRTYEGKLFEWGDVFDIKNGYYPYYEYNDTVRRTSRLFQEQPRPGTNIEKNNPKERNSPFSQEIKKQYSKAIRDLHVYKAEGLIQRKISENFNSSGYTTPTGHKFTPAMVGYFISCYYDPMKTVASRTGPKPPGGKRDLPAKKREVKVPPEGSGGGSGAYSGPSDSDLQRFTDERAEKLYADRKFKKNLRRDLPDPETGFRYPEGSVGAKQEMRNERIIHIIRVCRQHNMKLKDIAVILNRETLSTPTYMAFTDRHVSNAMMRYRKRFEDILRQHGTKTRGLSEVPAGTPAGRVRKPSKSLLQPSGTPEDPSASEK